MKAETYFFGTIILIFVILIGSIVWGGVRMYNTNTDIKEKCKKTEMVVIGFKGHAFPVYDCSNK